MADGDQHDVEVRRQLRDSFGDEPPGADAYLGLTRADAEARARGEGRRLADRSPDFHMRRQNLVRDRVNVLFDANDVVIDADIG